MSRTSPVTGPPRVVLDDRRTPRAGGGVADGELADPADLADLAELLAAVLALEGVAADVEAGLHLVDPAEMAELNCAHMGSDGPTDVLSFPVDGVEPDAVLAGDVVLCPEIGRAQAGEHAGTFLDECRLLVVHGGLHLCGWDHASEAERDAMWGRERDVMSTLGIAPSRDPWTTP